MMSQSRLPESIRPVGSAVTGANAVDFADMHRIHHSDKFLIRFGLTRDVAVRI
jgi:hypothetical protein